MHSVSTGDRLKSLQVRGQVTWEQLAKLLNISLSMLHQVKRGKRNLSDKALHRLASLEASVADAEEKSTEQNLRGLSTSIFGRDIYSSPDKIVKRAKEDAQIEVKVEDVERGFVESKLEYLSAEVAEKRGYPKKIRLKKPEHRETQKLLNKLQNSSDPAVVLLECLPEKYRSDSFLNLVSPFTVNAITEASFILTFGEAGSKLFTKFTE